MNNNQLQPSFPFGDKESKVYYGLSKLEYMATKLMAGMLANPTLSYGDNFDAVASKAITAAKILLEQLD